MCNGTVVRSVGYPMLAFGVPVGPGSRPSSTPQGNTYVDTTVTYYYSANTIYYY